MSTTMMWMLLGMLGGLGVTLVAAGLLPTRTRLSDALEALSAGVTSAGTLPSPQVYRSRQERLGESIGATASSLGMRAPTRDLMLLEIPTAQFWAEKTLYALIGLGMPMLYLLLGALMGLPLSPIPLMGGLIAAAALWLLPDLTIRRRAARTRWEMSVAVVSYLRLVAIKRLGAAAVTTSMEHSAMASPSWMFARIRQALQLARLSGIPPWEGLHQLADRLGLPELHEVADVTAQSAHGGAIAGALTARATSLRDRQLNATVARAGDVTTMMVGPLAVLAVTFMAALFIPAVVTLAG